MALNIYDTHYMLAAVREIPVEHRFFKDRYFPTDQAMDIFGTSRVLADYKTDTQKKAPFVLPRIGALPVGRDGFSTYDLEPANIAVSMPLTLDQLTKRGFGESLLSNLTPDQRARYFLIDDLTKLSAMISRAEEVLAVKTMIDNGCVMRHLTDDPNVYEDISAKFYDGVSNPAEFTPANTWAHSTKSGETWTPGNWYADICAMINALTSKGRPATEIIVSQDVADFLMNDGWVAAVLDNRRMEFGGIEPSELGPFVYNLGTFSFRGKPMPILVSFGTYEDESGNDVSYVPDGTVIVTAPGCGRGLYGAVTQIEADGEFHTYAGTRVPQHIFTMRPPVKETQLTSRPLFVPNRANPWTVAKNVI